MEKDLYYVSRIYIGYFYMHCPSHATIVTENLFLYFIDLQINLFICINGQIATYFLCTSLRKLGNCCYL